MTNVLIGPFNVDIADHHIHKKIFPIFADHLDVR